MSKSFNILLCISKYLSIHLILENIKNVEFSIYYHIIPSSICLNNINTSQFIMHLFRITRAWQMGWLTIHSYTMYTKSPCMGIHCHYTHCRCILTDTSSPGTQFITWVKCVASSINPLQIEPEKVRPTAIFSPQAWLEPTTSGLPDWCINPLRHIAKYDETHWINPGFPIENCCFFKLIYSFQWLVILSHCGRRFSIFLYSFIAHYNKWCRASVDPP